MELYTKSPAGRFEPKRWSPHHHAAPLLGEFTCELIYTCRLISYASMHKFTRVQIQMLQMLKIEK